MVLKMNDLDALEQQSLFILREAFSRIEKLALLWSIGKDSCAVLWLVKKAFFGHVPFPIVHVDTGCKMDGMIEFRDKLAKDWNLPLIVGQNKEALKQGIGPQMGRVTCCEALKTDGLKAIVAEHGFKGIIAGIRRDEEGTRAKERVFSPRGVDAAWNLHDQPPEFWDQYTTSVPPDASIRIHPILHWTELDIWRYIERENIPLVDLYFDKGDGQRYRSLGCAPCTAPIASRAASIAEIVTELETTTVSERSGRAQDKESEDAFEKLRANGYM